MSEEKYSVPSELRKAATRYIESLANRPAAYNFVESIFIAGATYQLKKSMTLIADKQLLDKIVEEFKK